MFFILSKIATFLLLPSNFLFLLGLAGLLLMATRWRRIGKFLAVASFVLFGLAGFLPTGRLLVRPLENRFPPWEATLGAPAGIIVLGGAIVPNLSRNRDQPAVNQAADRVIALAKLARQYPSARIIYSSGNAALFPGGPAEADSLLPLLDIFGVPRDRVELETVSRNTAENAALSKEIAKPKPGERWLLVTSASHMPRAVGCFRRAGFPVEAYPVNWHTSRRARLALPDNFASGLGQTDFAVHEWSGLLAYWLTGRTSELLPGPVAIP
jgi:uncharacterized SAM-binding protein YcdF (DUF218 family)